jgi:hypothetical protein
MPKAGETIPPSQEQPKKMPKGNPGKTSTPATSIEPPAGGVSVPIPPEVGTTPTPPIPTVPADLDRKDPF